MESVRDVYKKFQDEAGCDDPEEGHCLLAENERNEKLKLNLFDWKIWKRRDRIRIIFVLFTSPLLVIIILFGSTNVAFYHRGSSQIVSTEAWHNHQTIGVLTFRGPERILSTCRLILVEGKDENRKPEILSELSKSVYSVEEVSFETMLSIVTACNNLQAARSALEPTYSQSRQNLDRNGINMWTMLKGIVPGTKWCGVNDIAENYHDLGVDFELDKCCRAHDHCPIKIKAFSTNYGAKNNHPYTKSHCACDDLFFSCLRNITNPKDAEKASTVGRLFFNILRLECGEPRYQKVCVEIAKRNDTQSSEEADQSPRDVPGFKRIFFEQYNHSDKKTSEVCTQWVEDKDSIPSIVFRKQKKLF